MSRNISVVIAGATGLVGNAILNSLSADPDYSEIILLARREIPGLHKFSKARQVTADLMKPSEYRDQLKADTVICALGTTIKKAGSQQKFRDVDYKMPMLLADAASDNGTENFILISAIGADPQSRIFYNKVKGELERDLTKIKFRSLHILHPSLLMGHREEKRKGEGFAQAVMPIFNFLLPHKYRPVHAETLAAKVREIAKGDYAGVYIYEGKDLYPGK